MLAYNMLHWLGHNELTGSDVSDRTEAEVGAWETLPSGSDP